MSPIALFRHATVMQEAVTIRGFGVPCEGRKTLVLTIMKRDPVLRTGRIHTGRRGPGRSTGFRFRPSIELRTMILLRLKWRHMSASRERASKIISLCTLSISLVYLAIRGASPPVAMTLGKVLHSFFSLCTIPSQAPANP
jgi:hypothetical protein